MIQFMAKIHPSSSHGDDDAVAVLGLFRVTAHTVGDSICFIQP